MFPSLPWMVGSSELNFLPQFHSFKSSLLKSCSNYPSLHPQIHIHPVFVCIYMIFFFDAVLYLLANRQYFLKNLKYLLPEWQRLLLRITCFPALTVETFSLALPAAAVPNSAFCSVAVSYLQPGYMHGSTHPLSYLTGLYFFPCCKFYSVYLFC